MYLVLMNVNRQEDVMVIRTLECDICDRFDSVLLTRDELIERINLNSLSIGSHILSHGDHLRIVYFDIDANYLGDTISLNVRQQPLQNFDQVIPLFIKGQNTKWHKFRKRILQLLTSKNYNICIVGPSFAGKTSLTMYLESGGIPERYSKRINHSPTMGRSIKRFNLGRSKLTIWDMGGQKDFWDQWTDVVAQTDKVIFIIDGSANNHDEIINALHHVVTKMGSSSQMLLLNNKFDLFIDGYVDDFLSPDIVLPVIEKDLNKIWVINTSVYNGLAYSYSNKTEETDLIEIILDFINR